MSIPHTRMTKRTAWPPCAPCCAVLCRAVNVTVPWHLGMTQHSVAAKCGDTLLLPWAAGVQHNVYEVKYSE